MRKLKGRGGGKESHRSIETHIMAGSGERDTSSSVREGGGGGTCTVQKPTQTKTMFAHAHVSNVTFLTT